MANMPKQQKQLIILLGTAIVVIIFFFLLKPVAVGYSTYKDVKAFGVKEEYIGNMQEFQQENFRLEENVKALQENKVRLEQLQQEAADKAQASENDYLNCQEEFNKHKNISSQLVDSLAEEKAEVQQELKSCEDSIGDAGRRICCVERILNNPNIGSYEISNGKIICMEGSNGIEITC